MLNLVGALALVVGCATYADGSPARAGCENGYADGKAAGHAHTYTDAYKAAYQPAEDEGYREEFARRVAEREWSYSAPILFAVVGIFLLLGARSERAVWSALRRRGFLQLTVGMLPAILLLTACQPTFQDGYRAGYTEGYADGEEVGRIDGTRDGAANGRAAGAKRASEQLESGMALEPYVSIAVAAFLIGIIAVATLQQTNLRALKRGVGSAALTELIDPELTRDPRYVAQRHRRAAEAAETEDAYRELDQYVNPATSNPGGTA